MATKWINLKGRISWAQVYEPEEFKGDIRWILSFYPFDEAEWKKFNDSGLQLVPKDDKEGNKFVRLRRGVKKAFRNDDEVTYFTPPMLSGAVDVQYVNKDTGEKVRSYKKSANLPIELVGKKALLGNETVVIANIAVYETQQGMGHRLESLKVLDLVEYNPDREDIDDDGDVNETEVVETKVESQVVETKKVGKSKVVETKPTTSLKEDMNDEIPW